jgi:hypothetical protein
MEKGNKVENFLGASKSIYGNKYIDHYFGQYKLYVQSAEKISDRRQIANSYFIAINSALISLIGLTSEIQSGNIFLFKTLLSFLGIIICFVFWHLIRAYRQLNTGKFEVIHKIEESLPIKLYLYEWQVLGKGEDNDKYYPFSHIEMIIPWVFGFIYIALGLAACLVK